MVQSGSKSVLLRLLSGSIIGGMALASTAAFAQDASASTHDTPAPPAGNNAQNTPASNGALEEIVVTAERRSDNLQKVPASVSVRAGERLKEEGRFTLQQILEDVPAVNVTSTRGSGAAGTDTPNTAIVIRGIPSNVSIGGSSISLVPATASYVDDVYSGVGGDYDIDRVEILRGPQGTLYGRSATAGVVATKTRDPKLGVVGGEITGEVGSYNLFRTEGGFNLPVGDKIALRISGLHSEQDGFIAKRGDRRREDGFRTKLLAKPTDNLSVLLGFAMENDVTHSGELSGYIPSLARSNDVVYQAVQGFGLPYPAVGRNDLKFRQYWAEVKWDFGFANLTYIPALRTFDQDSNAFNETTNPIPPYSATNRPGIFFQPITTPHDHFDTQEVRLASHPGGKFTWQTGFFYYRNDVKVRNLNCDYPFAGTCDVIGTGLAGVPQTGTATQFNADRRAHKTTTDYGLFGEATYRFTDWLRFTGGLRYDWTKLHDVESYLRQPNALPFPPFLVPARQFSAIDTERKYHNFTYKARLEADLSPQSIVYASVSTGFLPGDVSIVQATIAGVDQLVVQDLDTETLHSYEIGTKNRFLDGKLQVNGALYYYDYGAYQLGGINIGSVASPSFVTLSSPAHVKGGEAEIAWQFTRNDRLGLSGSISDSKFVDRTTAFITNVALKQIPNVSKYTAQGSYNHRFDLGNGHYINFIIDGRYFSRQVLNTITTTGLALGDAPYIRVNGQFIGDANILWNLSKALSVSFYVRNISDNRYKNAAQLALAPAPPGGVAPPPSTVARQYDSRTFGGVVNVRF